MPFIGWQRQERPGSVQQTIEEAIYAFSGEKITLHAAGRTDSGVHAIGQVAHFDLERVWQCDTILSAVNYYLKHVATKIVHVEKVDPKFHARFSAIQRHYQYIILNRKAPPTFEKNRLLHFPYPLFPELMQKAANLLIGQHDFTSFRAANCQAKSPIKTLSTINIHARDDYILIDVSAPSFLYHQVRNITGSLLYVGKKKWTIDKFQTIFKACDRRQAGPTAPAYGLYFKKIIYP